MKALVLSGGGSHGAWQIGVVKKLYDQGARWDLIVGTSVGAVNAVGIASIGVNETVKLWLDLKGRSDLMALNFPWPWSYDGIFNFEPLRKLLNKKIHFPMDHAEAVACTMSTEDMSLAYASSARMPKDLFISNVIGSCVMVGFQSPEKGFLVDGGHREIAPLTYAIQRGATHIDVVSTMPVSEIKPGRWKPKGFFPIVDYIVRGIAAMNHEVILRDLATCKETVNVYAPKADLSFSIFDYSPKNMRESVAAGYAHE